MPDPNGVLEEVEKGLDDPLAGTGGVKMPVPTPIKPGSAYGDGDASLSTEAVPGAGILDDIGGVSAPQSDLIDTTGQVSAPSTVVDTTQPVVDPTAKELTDQQLVSGNLAKVLDEGGVLMDVARSAGDEYSQARGGLGSSMGAQASMRAMIDTALPIASQDAAAQVSQLQINQMNEVQQRRDEILQSYQLQMENLSTNNKSLLIDLEQKYAAAIQSDKNASDVYVSTMEAIADVMSNSESSIDQQIAGTFELTEMLGAYLDFNFNLTSVNAMTGEVTDAGVNTEENREETYEQQQAAAEEERLMEAAEIESLIKELEANPPQINEYSGEGGVLGFRYTADDYEVLKSWEDEQNLLKDKYQRLTGSVYGS